MRYLADPEALTELREYLIELDKKKREPENNLDLPFSQYAWLVGFIWVQVPGEKVKQYLRKHDRDPKILAEAVEGAQGSHEITVKDTKQLRKGDVVPFE